jgi:hypothetical protein
VNALAAVDEAEFDRLLVDVRAALTARHLAHPGYFEIRTELVNDRGEGFGLWLCGRCGANTEGRFCAEHNNDDLPGYYENWLRTSGGTVAGRCYCGKSTTNTTCVKHFRRSRAEREFSERLDRDEP